MKRLVASLVFAAVVLTSGAPFAQSTQPKPTTRVIPCDATCKHQQCTDKGAEHAKAVCRGASAENVSQCIVRNQRKYIDQCMRAPLGED